MTDQRCGTCRWWDRGPWDAKGWGRCLVEIPRWATPIVNRDTNENGYSDCPCYQRKESDEREATD